MLVQPDYLLEQVNIPHHVAIIMDGNRRWAKKRGMPSEVGYAEGVRALWRTVEAASEMGVKVLTVYGFSTENWNRSDDEVSSLLTLFGDTLERYTEEMVAKGVRLSVIGRMDRFPKALSTRLEQVTEATSGGSEIDLVLALDYGARDEIRRAVVQIAEEVKLGKLVPDQIDEALLAERLDTSKWPDPDLLIRTSGEQRLSNFLLWQLSYTEMVISDCLWPDFDGNALHAILSEYQLREQRNGR